MNIENTLQQLAAKAIEEVYGVQPPMNLVQIQKTKREFEGNYTLVVFPLLKISKKKPEETAQDIGEHLKQTQPIFTAFNVVKGFLNLSLSSDFWCGTLNYISATEHFGVVQPQSSGKTVMVEYSSPNTNKPLHLGHIRNNLLGYSITRILEANGHQVIKVNLVNDRGIHICKSMLAWQKFGNGQTPESTGEKGDHLVGRFYVMFENEYRKQIKELQEKGLSEEEAKAQAPIILEAQEMLRQWEAKQPQVYELWQTMNQWVYDGFDVTYRNMGVEFDTTYYESDTYLLGKSLVNEGLEKGVFFKKEDGSVWIDLTEQGLDQKLLLRADGTSVYMTQDLGTAAQRFSEHQLDDHIYVVGNEQEYHFKVLSLIMERLGYSWAKHLYHLSYGMVELPEGKMKSREGKVVDADDLIEEMVTTAKQMSDELGKLDEMNEQEASKIVNMIGLGALKYFILKVDPRKNMTFNPQESIDFNGHTGPFIQYTHARIQSVIRRANEEGIAIPQNITTVELGEKERELIQQVASFPEVVKQSGEQYSPALLANFAYDLAKEYNQFYHDHQIIREQDAGLQQARLVISQQVANAIRTAMYLLGIDVPNRM